VKTKVISLKFVSDLGEPVGYLMVETDDKKFAIEIATQWAKANLATPFGKVELHQGILDSPDSESEIFNGVQIWELPF